MSEIKPSDIEALLESFEASSWSEMKLKIDGLELFVSNSPGARPSAALFRAGGARRCAPGAGRGADRGRARARARPRKLVCSRAPNLGTFYRSPKPGAAPYVKVGHTSSRRPSFA